MGVIDGKQQPLAAVLQQRGAGRTQQRRRVADSCDVDQVAECAKRDLAGRSGTGQPLDRRAAVPLSKPFDGVPSKHCFADSCRAGKHCAQSILAFQRRLQKAQRLPARDCAPFNGHSRILRRPTCFLVAYEQTVADIAPRADLRRLETSSGLRVFSGAVRPYPAGTEQSPWPS